jgi:mannosyltransferase OCH1-like enzyme
MKRIHQIWLQGEQNLPEKYKKYSMKYKELNKNWEYKLWSQEDIRKLIEKNYPQLLKVWENYEFWVMRVDLGKYCILDFYGGILVDMDTKPVGSFDSFLELTNGNPTVIESFYMILTLLGERMANNHFIYIPYPNHPLTAILLKNACCIRDRTVFDFKFYYIIARIGPLFFSEAIKEYGYDKVTWIAYDTSRKYFLDEAANSWNKSMFDTHDYFWGSVLLAIFCLTIYAMFRVYRKDY